MTRSKPTQSFKELNDKEVCDKASELSTADKLKDYFSEFLEHSYIDTAGQTREEQDLGLEELNLRETQAASGRAKSRLATTAKLPIKLQLCKLSTPPGFFVTSFASLLEIEFGPTHAALLIGEGDDCLVLEWNTSDLVIPHYNSSQRRLLKVGYQSPVTKDVCSQFGSQMDAAARSLKYDEQFDLLFDATVEKAKVIDDLIAVIIRYNKAYYYHPFTRNCQNFVIDAMKALKITNPYNFGGRLMAYFNELKQGKQKNIPGGIDNHADLDSIVMRSIEQLKKHDVEFYLSHYYHFHWKSLEESQDQENWTCPLPTCQIAKLDAKLDKDDLVLSQFLSSQVVSSS